MSRNWKQTGLTIVLSGLAVLAAAIGGLFLYMTASVTPLHPNPAAVSTVTQSAPLPQWTGAVARAREMARAGLTAQNLPGLSVAVGVDRDIVWAEGLGWADLEEHEPVTPGTRFRTGGASIALTSAAAGLLMEKGQLVLDDEIQTYVPEFPKKQWPVTVRQLMGHLAGVSPDGGDEEPLSVRCDRTVDALPRFADRPLLFEPETKYRYSTYGWILVSAAVEAAADVPFFTFMRTHIFDPLGMRDTMPDDATEPVSKRTTFYYPRFAADTRYGPDPASPGDYSCFAGAGGFLATPSDLVRFGIAFNGGTLLQPATVAMLQAPQRLSSGEETGYGLGWDLETVSLGGQPTRMVGHDDEYTIGGSASLMTFPEHGIVVVVMSNISFAHMAPLAESIAQVFAKRGNSPAAR